jgi:hypothetical protein
LATAAAAALGMRTVVCSVAGKPDLDPQVFRQPAEIRRCDPHVRARIHSPRRLDMVAIARTGVVFRTPTDTPKRATPNLDAQVRTYRAQLADWVTCPSAKTPQGKEKIEQISAKLESVRNQIKKLDGTSLSATTDASTQSAAASSDATPRSDDHADYLSASGQVGASVDTYA